MVEVAKEIPKTSPYVGPVPFSINDKDFFFGRENETEKLFSLVISQQVVLFYAKSGAGKSSLINARLIPNLKDINKESFKITETFLKKLKTEVLPENILKNLESLRDKEIKGKKEFLEELKKKLGEEQTTKYESLILEHADNSYIVIGPVRIGNFAVEEKIANHANNIYIFNTLLSLAGNEKKHLDKYYTDGKIITDDFVSQFSNTRLASFLAEYIFKDKKELYKWIIFDQFEELLTSYPEHWQKRREFFEQLRKALDEDKKLSIVLVMREDQIASLEPYAPLLPDGLQTRFYMELLEEEQALYAIEEPAKLCGISFVSKNKDDDGDNRVAKKLTKQLLEIPPSNSSKKIFNSKQPFKLSLPGLPFLTGFLMDMISLTRVLSLGLSDLNIISSKNTSNEQPKLGQYIEPVHLQIVCLNIWNEVKKKDGKEITLDDIKNFGNVDSSLKSFYEKVITAVISQGKDNITEIRLRGFFSGQLITNTYRRAQIEQKTAEDELSPAVVKALQDSYIIRIEQARNEYWVEISHDRLIMPILESNRKILRRKTAQVVQTVILLLYITLFSGFYYFYSSYNANQIDNANQEANRAKLKAVQEQLEKSTIEKKLEETRTVKLKEEGLDPILRKLKWEEKDIKNFPVEDFPNILNAYFNRLTLDSSLSQEEKNNRKDIKIRFYQKNDPTQKSKQQLFQKYLENMGFQPPKIEDKEALIPDPINTVFYGTNVGSTNAKIITLALIQAGFEIKCIFRYPDRPEYKNIVNVGTKRAISGQKHLLTPDEIISEENRNKDTICQGLTE